jgi:hypothetical protein
MTDIVERLWNSFEWNHGDADLKKEAIEEIKKLRKDVAIQECLAQSAYIAGAKFGWNCGVTGDETKFQAAVSSTEHLAEIKRIRGEKDD